jgi:hypothetical protein
MKQHIQLMSAIRGHVAGYGWAVSWFCGALGVSRSGFHAWLVRAPLARAQSDDAVSRKIKASFTLSDRTYSRPSRSNESAGKSIGHAIRPRLTCSIISSVSTIPPAGTRRWAMSVLSTSNARRGWPKKAYLGVRQTGSRPNVCSVDKPSRATSRLGPTETSPCLAQGVIGLM